MGHIHQAQDRLHLMDSYPAIFRQAINQFNKNDYNKTSYNREISFEENLYRVLEFADLTLNQINEYIEELYRRNIKYRAPRLWSGEYLHCEMKRVREAREAQMRRAKEAREAAAGEAATREARKIRLMSAWSAAGETMAEEKQLAEEAVIQAWCTANKSTSSSADEWSHMCDLLNMND